MLPCTRHSTAVPPCPDRRAALLTLAAVALTGCWPDTGPDYYELADPPDLRVRQSPNDTIRVGETVTFTAVFRDSLNPKWLYTWTFNVDGAVPVFDTVRSARWTPLAPGSYRSNVWVSDVRASSRATITFSTTVLP